MFSFSEKKGDHLLGSASWASNFCWIWLILKHLYNRLLFNFGLIRVNPRFIICHARIFWAFWANCVGSNANKFFWQSNVHAILNVWWSHKCLRLSQSHDRSHDDPATSVGTQLQWFTEQQLILDGFHEIRLGVNYDLDWIHHTSDKHWSLMEPHL